MADIHVAAPLYLCGCSACAHHGEAGPGGGNGQAKPVWSLGQVTGNLTRIGAHWSGSTVSFGFFASAPGGGYGSGEAAGFSAFSAAQKAAAETAVAMWDDVMATSLVAQADQNLAQVRFANTSTGPGHAWGYYPLGTAEAGDVWINPSSSSNLQLGAGGYGLLTLVHEIGHALGLAHPGYYNGSAHYASDARYAQDSRQYSVMSYFNAAYSCADHMGLTRYGYAAGPLLHDIAAIQAIYSADMTTRAGNTVYGFNATAGRDAFDFTVNTAPVVAIWDAGGIDTLDLSGFAGNSVINLEAGGFSDAGGMTANIAIAYGVTIENAVGGVGHDVLIGNHAANDLRGGDGNDTLFGGYGDDRLDGGGGTDTASYASAGSVRVDLGLITAQGTGAGADTLLGIENLTGGPGNDLLFGNDATNQLVGGAGSDLLAAGGGGDRLFGGNGNDDLYGGAGGDVLYGQDGSDALFGGAGRDALYGGAGGDRFCFGNVTDSRAGSALRDVIYDFNSKQRDRIDLRGVDADTDGSPGDQAFRFIGTKGFKGVDGELRFANNLLQGDTDGDRVADFQIEIYGTAQLSAADFLL